MMNNVLRNMAIMLLAVSVILSGCATTNGKKILKKTVVVAISATTCGAAGYLANGERGAVIAAITCAIAAYTIDELVAKRQQGYAKREEAIVVETKLVKHQTETLKAENQKLAQDIRHYEQKIHNLKNHNVSLQAQKRVVETRHKEAKQKLDQAKTDLANARTQYDRQNTASTKNDAELNKWKTQVANLEKEKNALQDNVNTLFSMTQAI
ncbi:MAG: hypothetical protein ABFS56_12830 [Pseudomonadota bacterium]